VRRASLPEVRPYHCRLGKWLGRLTKRRRRRGPTVLLRSNVQQAPLGFRLFAEATRVLLRKSEPLRPRCRTQAQGRESMNLGTPPPPTWDNTVFERNGLWFRKAHAGQTQPRCCVPNVSGDALHPVQLRLFDNTQDRQISWSKAVQLTVRNIIPFCSYRG
jgi:hypothetical protein